MLTGVLMLLGSFFRGSTPTLPAASRLACRTRHGDGGEHPLTRGGATHHAFRRTEPCRRSDPNPDSLLAAVRPSRRRPCPVPHRVAPRASRTPTPKRATSRSGG